MVENEISRQIIGAAIEVHKEMGPGLLESVYLQCLVRELQLRNVSCITEHSLNAEYKGLKFDIDYRIDMLVEDRVLVELKVVEAVLPVHCAQLLSYLKLSQKRLGLLINFNVDVLRNGIKRIANQL
ncbi:MAG: GxxExxY protein [Pseudomonadota bacterium]|nr:GxxExxY protein [Pseudomonadota bacterium]